MEYILSCIRRSRAPYAAEIAGYGVALIDAGCTFDSADHLTRLWESNGRPDVEIVPDRDGHPTYVVTN